MDGETLVGIIVPTAFIIGATLVILRLLVPFAEALAARLRPPPPELEDGLRGELRSLAWRVDALERERTPPALPGSSVVDPHQEES